MDNFEYQCCTKIIFGKGTEALTGEEIKKIGKKALLHYGSGSVKKNGAYSKVVSSLNKAGIDFVELPGVVPNPRLGLVKKGIEICRKNNIDCILAIGGGSTIDSAKAIAAGFYYDGDPWDFFSKGVVIEKTLPIGVVLTISAAGSESSTAMVITNITSDSGPLKYAATSDLLRPKFAIMNPELMFTLPKFQTACGIADMMAHIFERYFTNSKGVDLTDKLCEGALKSIIRNARIVMQNSRDYDARANLMWAATIAHNDLLGTGREEDWASHGIEHQLSAHYDIAHGAGLAIIFPAWMTYVHGHDVKLFAQFAREVWSIKEKNDRRAALRGIERTKAFFKEIGLPVSLKEAGIGDDKFVKMAESAEGRGSFVKLSKADIIKIYQLAMGCHQNK